MPSWRVSFELSAVIAVFATAYSALVVYLGFTVCILALAGAGFGATAAYAFLVLRQQHPTAKRIILIRHGESVGNVDVTAYTRLADHSVPLTEAGKEQARQAGRRIKSLIGDEPVVFFVSPYERTRETFAEIHSQLTGNRVLKAREECRLRELEFSGAFQDPAAQTENARLRRMYGKFFFRPAGGESGADVMDRVTTFLDTLFRSFKKIEGFDSKTNVILVTHGLTMRVFLMRFFHWTVELFERTENPVNCGFVVLERISGFYRMRPESAQAIGLQPHEVWTNAKDTVRRRGSLPGPDRLQ